MSTKKQVTSFLIQLIFWGGKLTAMSLIALATFFLALAFGGEDEIPPSVAESYRNVAVQHIDRGLMRIAEGNLYNAKAEFYYVIHMPYESVLGHEKSVAYLNSGVISFMEDDPDSAIKYYQASIRLRPDYTEAYFNLGAAYYKQRNLKMAEEAFVKAIELQPDYGRAHYSLGSLYFDQKKYDLAWKHAQKAEENGVPYKTLRENLTKFGK